MTVVRVARQLPERADAATACPTLAVRVGGCSTTSVDDELQIALGADDEGHAGEIWQTIGRNRRERDEVVDDEAKGLAMLQTVEEELKTLTRGLAQALGLAQSAELIDAILRGRKPTDVDIWCLTPHVYQYYSAREQMVTHFVSQFDEHTIPFGDFVWGRAGTVQRPYPMPGLLHSWVHGLNNTPMYASELITAVFFGHVSVTNAARLILLCLTKGAGSGYCGNGLTSFPSDATKTKVALTLRNTITEWAGTAAILLTHVVARTLEEWKTRHQEGYHVKQWKVLQRLVEEYADYLECRALDGTFRQHGGLEFSAVKARVYAENVNRRLRRAPDVPAPHVSQDKKARRPRAVELLSHNAAQRRKRARSETADRRTSADTDTASQDLSAVDTDNTALAKHGRIPYIDPGTGKSVRLIPYVDPGTGKPVRGYYQRVNSSGESLSSDTENESPWQLDEAYKIRLTPKELDEADWRDTRKLMRERRLKEDRWQEAERAALAESLAVHLGCLEGQPSEVLAKDTAAEATAVDTVAEAAAVDTTCYLTTAYMDRLHKFSLKVKQ